MKDQIGDGLLIRYDGLDAANHEIELGSLAESLKGLSRIIGVTGNFVATERFVQHRDAMSVKVVVRPPEAHCFEVMAYVKWAAENPLISGTLATLLAGLITYIFKRAAGQREEMRAIKDSLDKAIQALGHRDQNQIDRMMDTIDRLADALRPAARQAVAPIGNTAASLTVGNADRTESVTIGAAERDAILSDSEIDVGDERDFRVMISELDMETGACRVSLADDLETRIGARITDPAFAQANNPYVSAMASRRPIGVRAKPTLRDGVIERLFISDFLRN
ncbi:hypothetical protein GCM10011390_41830 [Aureimonas endophytica]|uniref:Uncharacterized protein n=1 Tax=Aureimonas endophytica TaxID=2027858 RepID=A0A916ZXX9_9HYPH|nr:hypothetical protein [Aureimonas endophytica]GGE18293.1 hypothetical protein GCM10011390_41830 [Aureimonas endophytica]